MSFESYTKLYENYHEGVTLRPKGTPMTLTFDKKGAKNEKYRLFVVGESEMFYQWRSEPDVPQHYHSICDALDTENARKTLYCLNLSSNRRKSISFHRERASRHSPPLYKDCSFRKIRSDLR